MIEDIDEDVCMEFDEGKPRAEHKMILQLLIKVRQLIAKENERELHSSETSKENKN